MIWKNLRSFICTSHRYIPILLRIILNCYQNDQIPKIIDINDTTLSQCVHIILSHLKIHHGLPAIATFILVLRIKYLCGVSAWIRYLRILSYLDSFKAHMLQFSRQILIKMSYHDILWMKQNNLLHVNIHTKIYRYRFINEISFKRQVLTTWLSY